MAVLSGGRGDGGFGAVRVLDGDARLLARKAALGCVDIRVKRAIIAPSPPIFLTVIPAKVGIQRVGDAIQASPTPHSHER